MQRALIRVGSMRRVVQKDFKLTLGGPVGAKTVVASFTKGDILHVRRIGKRHDYPKMYQIVGTVHEGRRGILTQFLRGFEPRKRDEEPWS